MDNYLTVKIVMSLYSYLVEELTATKYDINDIIQHIFLKLQVRVGADRVCSSIAFISKNTRARLILQFVQNTAKADIDASMKIVDFNGRESKYNIDICKIIQRDQCQYNFISGMFKTVLDESDLLPYMDKSVGEQEYAFEDNEHMDLLSLNVVDFPEVFKSDLLAVCSICGDIVSPDDAVTFGRIVKCSECNSDHGY